MNGDRLLFFFLFVLGTRGYRVGLDAEVPASMEIWWLLVLSGLTAPLTGGGLGSPMDSLDLLSHPQL